ncbi:MAG TPA: hypothetical protein VEL11_06040, partial [Candidatus Bathyarchaeia archaeon]|nr:hypothetical protein [Candidatus Bathyarchaeia archaeon]
MTSVGRLTDQRLVHEETSELFHGVLFHLKSHKSNRVLILRDYIISAASDINASGGANADNPTNLGVSDFSLVAATLDKFCVEYKSSLID